MQGVFKTGIVLIIISFGMWIYKDKGNSLPLSSNLDSMLLWLGCVCIVFFVLTYLYAMLTRGAGKTSKKKCVRCGKKIPKGEMYCEFHKQQVTKQFRDNVGDHRHER